MHAGILRLRSLVVKIFVDERIGQYSFKSALRIPLIEQLFNGITPFSSGGQPAQLIAMLQSGIMVVVQVQSC